MKVIIMVSSPIIKRKLTVFLLQSMVIPQALKKGWFTMILSKKEMGVDNRWIYYSRRGCLACMVKFGATGISIGI